MLRNQKGFTLIELIVIIVIIGILAAVAIPAYINLVNEAQEGTARGVLGGIRSANALLFASRLVGAGATTASYTWPDIVDSAQIQGVSVYTPAAGTPLTITVNNVDYVFSMNPTNPAAPTNMATIYCPAHADW